MSKIAYNTETGKIITKEGKICSTCCGAFDPVFVLPAYDCCCFRDPNPTAPEWSSTTFYPYLSIVTYSGQKYYCAAVDGVTGGTVPGTVWAFYAHCNNSFWNTAGRGYGGLGKTPLSYDVDAIVRQTTTISYTYYGNLSWRGIIYCARSGNWTLSYTQHIFISCKGTFVKPASTGCSWTSSSPSKLVGVGFENTEPCIISYFNAINQENYGFDQTFLIDGIQYTGAPQTGAAYLNFLANGSASYPAVAVTGVGHPILPIYGGIKLSIEDCILAGSSSILFPDGVLHAGSWSPI